jgi:hypothetical protein
MPAMARRRVGQGAFIVTSLFMASGQMCHGNMQAGFWQGSIFCHAENNDGLKKSSGHRR